MNARYIYVTSYDGDQLSEFFPQDRAAISTVQDAMQKWGKFILVYEPNQADIVLMVMSRPAEDVLAVYDAHGWPQNQYLWRMMGRSGLQPVNAAGHESGKGVRTGNNEIVRTLGRGFTLIFADLNPILSAKIWSIKYCRSVLLPKVRGELLLGLALPTGNHQPSSNHDKNDTRNRRNSLVVVRRDAYMRVPDVNPVMFGMREGNKERSHSQHQHNNSNQHQYFQSNASTLRMIESRPNRFERIGCESNRNGCEESTPSPKKPVPDQSWI